MQLRKFSKSSVFKIILYLWESLQAVGCKVTSESTQAENYEILVTAMATLLYDTQPVYRQQLFFAQLSSLLNSQSG
jgi:hypothetical protein